jgi:putative copper resistance protein D
MYFSALLVIGACAFILIIATRVSHLSGSYLEVSAVIPSTRRLARWATVVLAFALVARLLAQGFMLGEGEEVIIQPVLDSTLWGTGWLIGAGGTLLIAAGLIFTRGTRNAWRVSALGAVALAVSFALTGHATAAPTNPAVHVAADAIHVIAAGGWLGTLLIVASIGLRTVMMLPLERRAHAAAELIGVFSNLALLCVGTLLVTGTFAAWSLLPNVQSLWTTPYGLALTRKLVVIAMTGLVGIFNWRFVQPRLNDPETISLLRRSAFVEIGIGVAVVILTAWLVGTSPPDSDDAQATAMLRGAHIALATPALRG